MVGIYAFVHDRGNNMTPAIFAMHRSVTRKSQSAIYVTPRRITVSKTVNFFRISWTVIEKSWPEHDWRLVTGKRLGTYEIYWVSSEELGETWLLDKPLKMLHETGTMDRKRGSGRPAMFCSESGRSTTDSSFHASDFQKIWHSSVVRVLRNSCRPWTEMPKVTTRARADWREPGCSTSTGKKAAGNVPRRQSRFDLVHWWGVCGDDCKESAKWPTTCTLQQPCKKGNDAMIMCQYEDPVLVILKIDQMQ